MPRWGKVVMAVLLAAFAAISCLLMFRWPYTQERVIGSIERATGSRVRIQRFRRSVFPEPGCSIEGVEIARRAPHPIARAEKLTLRSSWWNVLALRKRVDRVQAQNLQLEIAFPFPPPVTAGSSDGLGELVIGEFVADGTDLDILRNNESPLRFKIQRLRLGDVGKAKQITYVALLDIPAPPGQLQSSGRIGPISWDDQARTPVAGSFELRGGRLGKYEGIGGTLNGTGMFRGPLENVRVSGTAVASRFEINHNGHSTDLHTSYRADVNGLSGQVILDAVQADFLGTRLTVNGTITGKHNKAVSLHFIGDCARIEDLLSLFTRSPQPALRGPIDFRADTDLLQGDEPFLHRLLLRGRFRISDARWVRTNTQTKVDGLSARARGDKKKAEELTAEPVLSQLTGEVSLKQGLALLSGVSFHVPGATATGGGTYNLLTKRVALKGTVSMIADASEAASGFKSVLLKPFDRLFRDHKHKGATLPVSIVGHYPRPEYRIGLTK